MSMWTGATPSSTRRPMAPHRPIRRRTARARSRSTTTCRGAALTRVHLGSGEFPCRLRVLGTEAIAPGSDGLHPVASATTLSRCSPATVSCCGNPGRGETDRRRRGARRRTGPRGVRARPDRSVDRVVAERGGSQVDELERLTGEVGGNRSSASGSRRRSRSMRRCADADRRGSRSRPARARRRRSSTNVERAVLATIEEVVGRRRHGPGPMRRTIRSPTIRSSPRCARPV